MTTSRSVAAVALVALLVTSGCIGFVSGEEALVYEANEAGVSEETRQQTGYERQLRENITVNQTVSEREIRIENWYARYEKYDEIADEKTGVFAVVSTHRVDVFGRTTNPFAEMTYEQLLTNLTSSYDTSFGEVDDLEFVKNETRTVLGKEATVGVYKTTTEFDGETVEVKIYVTRVKHGDDYVIALGGHPTKLPAGEQDILALMEGIEHQTDDENTSERIVAADDGAAALNDGNALALDDVRAVASNDDALAQASAERRSAVAGSTVALRVER